MTSLQQLQTYANINHCSYVTKSFPFMDIRWAPEISSGTCNQTIIMQFPPHMCVILFQILHIIFSGFGLIFFSLLLREKIEYRSYPTFILL